jgi:DNA repair ATPase RecN
MTNHPLTQKKVWKLVENVAQTTDWNNCDEYEDVLYARAAADWQLEQVIEQWEEVMDSTMTDIQVIREFDKRLKAMRPQEES